MSARPLRGLAAWMTAAWVALTLLRRLWRGEVVVLSQYGAPVVRLLAIALVFLASCAEKVRAVQAEPQDQDQETRATPTPAPEVVVDQEFPDGLTDADLQRAYSWIAPRTLHRYFYPEAMGEVAGSVPIGDMGEHPLPAMREPDEEMRRRGEVLQAAIDAHRRTAHLGPTAAELLALLDAAEALSVYDEWFAGHLWRHARTLRPAPVALLARIERHLRIVHALTMAQASTGPLEFSAWRSKAGPPPGWQRLRVPPGLVAAAREAFKQGADAGTWESEASLELTVARGEVVLIKRAGETRIAAGAPLRLRRLDVVRAPAAAVLRHPTLGELALPAGAELGAWNVAQFLDRAARAWVQGRLRAVLDGEATAVTELEAVLPAAHEAIRAALADAEGRETGGRTAALRLLLQAFDE